jgi:anti-anti-sigma regulatory factor
MLRIHIEEQCKSVTIQLEGRLVGDWVEELKRCWHSAEARSRDRNLIIELYAVSFVDISGRSLLAEMYGAGVTLVGRGVWAQNLVERIQQVEVG